MIILSCDPGITGAIAILETDGECFAVFDMPIMPKSSGKGSQVDPESLCKIIKEAIIDYGAKHAIIESVSASPQMGVTSAFSFGKSLGCIEGVLAGRLPFHHVTPQMWKARAGLIRTDKDRARLLAIRLFPEIKDQLTRKKDIGRADAMLIGYYGG